MKKIRVALQGASGKMGREIILASESLKDELLITQFIAREKSKLVTIADVSHLSPKNIDVLIDFSEPKAMSKALNWCVQHKIAFVSGTTGISQKQEQQIVTAGKKIPVFWASNFSLGVALMTEMLKVFADQDDFDFQIEEFHHRHKKDKPSGTAKSLQREFQKILGKKLPEPVSVRGGEIFGIHKVWAMSSSENILLEHTALNRSVFAKGALRASLWLARQKPGTYTMRDLLDF